MNLLSSNVLFLLKQYGRTTTLRKNTYGAYDPTMGTVASTTSVDYSVKCYFADYNLSEVDNQSILLGDRKAYLGRLDIYGDELPIPDVEDQLLGLGDTVNIVRVQQIWNNDRLVCYICQVRE